MKFIDTHAHIQFAAYDDILDKVLADAAEHETGVIVVGCEQESSEAAVALVKDRPGLWAAVGQHPTDTGLPFDIKKFRELAEYEKVVAVGECGLDYYRLDGSEVLRLEVIEKQKELFEAQITLAHERNVPLIIHCRDAHPDMIAILLKRFSTPSSHPHPPKEHGVLHCFTGTVADAQSYLDLNFLISFTGIITFADQYDDVVRRVPLEKCSSRQTRPSSRQNLTAGRRTIRRMCDSSPSGSPRSRESRPMRSLDRRPRTPADCFIFHKSLYLRENTPFCH